VPIKLELIDDLDRKGHHHVDTYLDQSRKHTWQSHQIIVDIDMNPNDVGVFGPYKFKVSDRFEDYCIFANRLRAELDYTDDDKSNNVWLNDLFVTLGTRETDCVASAAISAISGAVSSVCDKAVIESSQPLLKTIQESYNNALIAFEKLDFDAAREAIIRLFLKLPQKYQTDFLISFANNFIEDFLTLPNCALAGYAQITNFFLDLEDDLIDVGVSQDTIEIINKIVKTGLTKI